MPVTDTDRLNVFLALEPASDFASASDPDAVAARTNLSPETAAALLGDPAARAAFRLDPNAATGAQLARLSDLEGAPADALEAARPFFTLSELEAASGLPGGDIDALFRSPRFHLPGTMMPDQALVPDPGEGLVVIGEPLPDAARFEALGFRAEHRGGPPPRLILRPGPGAGAAARNVAKALAGGRILPAMRDADGIARFFLPGHADIWFAPGTGREAAGRVLKAAGLVLAGWEDASALALGRLAGQPDGRDAFGAVSEALIALREAPAVELAEPHQFAAEREPFERAGTDFLASRDGAVDWWHALVGLPEAHAVTRGDPSVTIFVIDSGIDLDHPDLAAALRPDWAAHDLDFEPDTDGRSPFARGRDLARYHGTAVSGMAVGQAPAGSAGVTGVAPGARLMPMRIRGSGRDYAQRALAIRRATDLVAEGGRGVINLSWQVDGAHEGIYAALRRAAAAGLAIAASAGNYASLETRIEDKPHYPSAFGLAPPLDAAGRPRFPEVIGTLMSVGAVDSEGRRASYSYFGDRAVTIAAPGGEAGGPGRALWLAGSPVPYLFDQGTSYSAPAVAGALALLMGLGLDAASAVERLKATARPLPEGSGMGAGLLALASAVNGVRAPSPPEDGLAPPGGQGPARIDVNAADAAALARLPLLGPWSAARLVARREASRGFAGMDDVRAALGLDDWAWSILLPRLALGPAQSRRRAGIRA